MTNLTTAPTSIKTARGRRTESVGRRIEWGELVRGLGDSRARPGVLARFATAGFTPDEFNSTRKAREAMADSLTWAEGWLEELPVRASDNRKTIRDLRRRLEWELWP